MKPTFIAAGTKKLADAVVDIIKRADEETAKNSK